MIGRYVLCDPIAAGGMATVHLGRLVGSEGFSRVVAIKRLHESFALDPDFRAMFLDEARLASRVRHANVVPSIDVITLDREALLVMEYIPGEPLSYFTRRANHEKRPIPLEIAVSLITGALHGLHAAHEARGERGEPLGIVHRDVSPHNIMVGADGVARVMDFGVAKASGRMQQTREGQIKGKIAYMAPEQITGRGVTHQSDVFSAAVVLWEALTARRLFAAENDVEAMYNILERPMQPPGALSRGLPIALDEIVMKGLARDPAERYQTALEMASALEAALPPVASSAVARWVVEHASASLTAKTAMCERIENDRALDALAESGSRIVSSPPARSSTALRFATPVRDQEATRAEVVPAGAREPGGLGRKVVPTAIVLVACATALGVLVSRRAPDAAAGQPTASSAFAVGSADEAAAPPAPVASAAPAASASAVTPTVPVASLPATHVAPAAPAPPVVTTAQPRRAAPAKDDDSRLFRRD
ncbi:MAG: serine/threonine protein kinase [Polyangiaceae bacterium]|nr:serine/threonine protein kinase [Polyangiaceae bacterium]